MNTKVPKLLLVISLLLLTQLAAEPSKNVIEASALAPEPDSWPMLAANPQRTSWTPEEVRGNLAVDWYHPIEPYIPYKIQPIAANGRLYISTSRGLYTFSADDGSLLWVYPTELPLGHSPTVSAVNGQSVVFVGGYDRKIHAVNANTGEAIPGYNPFEAGAGFETNPLVVESTIYSGNRDGFFYALDAVTGGLRWKYKTEGPILFSAAYNDGIVYFASNDAHAYAIDTSNGSLIWKSQKLPGSGFYSFWPVIYTDSATGKDYVIFTGGENYRFHAMNLVVEESDTIYTNTAGGDLLGPASTNIAGNWASGTVVLDASIFTNYFEDRPDRRTVFVLDANSGQEFTFDSDGDGRREYAPFNWSGVTHSGSKYPPIVNGIDGVYYQSSGYVRPGWISRGGPVGWKFGTQYISEVHGDPDGHASDEPMAYSSGGKVIYWSLCCDRESGAFDVTIPYGQPNRSWVYYEYNLASNVLAPGYQQMYDDGDASSYNQLNGWQVYSGAHQSKNGVYGKHGTAQSPPIPYDGKLYVLKGNALIAFSPDGTNPKTPLPLATAPPTESSSVQLDKSAVTQLLETEVQKVVAAGPLRPGYHDAGFIDLYGSHGYSTDERTFGEIFDYFQNPADTIYTLLLAYPQLTPAVQMQVKSYLQTYYGPGTTYDFTKIAHVGWGTGAAREYFEIPPDMSSDWDSLTNPTTTAICSWCGYWQFPPFSFYAAWQYAQIIGNGESASAKNIFDRMSSNLNTPPDDGILLRKPYWLNQYIAGYFGYLELQQMAGYPKDQNVQATYQHLLDLRVNGFSKDTPYPSIGSDDGDWEEGYSNSLAVARNFMFLTPELATYLRQHINAQIQDAIDEYEYVAPYWFVSSFDASYGEGSLQHLYDPPALFQAKAYILQESFGDLSKWLDVPAFYRGDLFYIQNLVAALAAPSVAGPTPTPGSPSTTATPGATATPGPGTTPGTDLEPRINLPFLSVLATYTPAPPTATPVSPTSTSRPDTGPTANPTSSATATPVSNPTLVASQKRRMNVPFLTDKSGFTPGILWFGQVDRTSNYADVRIWHDDDILYVVVHIIDRLLWKDDSPSISDLTKWDAVSIYVDRDGATDNAPSNAAYHFAKQLWNAWVPESRAVYQGDGNEWTVSAVPFDVTDTWRGNGPNDMDDDKGWLASFEIPFASLGLSEAPPDGTVWGLAVTIHDRDDASGTTIPDKVWPESMNPSQPATWGELRFGMPSYSAPQMVSTGTTTIRQGLDGANVPDAHVGGHTNCGDGLDHWTEWGNANYAGYTQINIQNQWDVSDYPCFSKYFVTFPLDSIPPGKTVISATLTMYLFGNAGYEPGDSLPSDIQALTVRDDWDESTISWNNAPLAVENVATTWVYAVDFFDPGVPYSWNVSGAVEAAYSKGQPLRLALYSTDGELHSGKYFWSSDVSDFDQALRPRLEVVWGDAVASSSQIVDDFSISDTHPLDDEAIVNMQIAAVGDQLENRQQFSTSLPFVLR